LDCK
jgi:hypothetical protein